ncbi:hypothetical protein [Paenibacillus sp. Y412MC10]|uniref:hypothetical protein n=2 Tax=Bacillati TaxID=1783272 RepID=UPI0011AB8330|nr:hypothetical protein [Paenibacillus sp. Y412MC10]
MQGIVLGNKLGIEQSLPTYPVKVTSLFLNHLFDMNLNFSSRLKFAFRDGGTERLRDHLTQADLQVVFVLFRCCNAFGYIELTNRKALYRRLELEFEDPISEGQFYASIEKFIQHELIVLEESVDGMTRHKLNYFLNEKTNKIGHYVLFHPFVFSKAFNLRTLAEKKLIISAYAQASGNPNKVITRNLKQTDKSFRHAQFAGLITFLHKTQRSHVAAILSNLREVHLPVCTQAEAPLFSNIDMVDGKSGYKAQMSFNPDFLIPVKEEESEKYYMPLDVCSLYPRFYSFLLREANAYGVGEILADRHMANRLVKTLRPISARLIRYAFHQLKRFKAEKGVLPMNPEYVIKENIHSKFNTLLDAIITKAGAEEFVRYPETRHEYIKERKWSFAIAAEKSRLGLKKLQTRIEDAVHKLNLAYPVQDWELADYGAWVGTYQYQELRRYLDIDRVKKEALRLKVDPYYYGDIEYNALHAIRKMNPKAVEEWMLGELRNLPILAGKRLIPYSFRLEDFVFAT